jgi:uncharacterized membrane protein
MLKRLIFLFLFIFLTFGIFGVEYYGDLQIDVNKYGKTTISGNTNYNDLIIINSDEYTSKLGSVWTFELNIPEIFSDYIFELNLPIGANINYLKTTPTFRIANGENSNIKIIGTGENRPLNILIQYTFENSTSSNVSYFGYLFSYFLLGVVVLVIILFVIYRKIKKSKIMSKIVQEVSYDIDMLEEVVHDSVLGIDYSKFNLNERQLQIVDILKKYGKISQKDLMDELNIPKASVSRNLQSMLSKKIISIKKNGITNIISLLK